MKFKTKISTLRSMAFSLLFMLVFAGAANAVDVHPEIGVGLSNYANIVTDGIWYQQGLPHTFQRKTRAFSLGLTGTAWAGDRFGLDWHADYVNLGHVRVSCWCTTIDQDYDTDAHRLRVPESQTPMAHYSGNGLVQGFKFTLAPYVNLGRWRVGVEGGLFLYRPSWRSSVYGWSPSVESDLRIDGSHTLESRWLTDKVLGFYASRGNWTVSYLRYDLPKRRYQTENPPLWNDSNMLQIVYKFK